MSKKPSLENIFSATPLNNYRAMQKEFGFTDDFIPKNVELFAGAGGFGAGAAMAGLHFDIAINHNPVALAVHKVNFPHATQMINDVFEHNPIDVLVSQGVPTEIFKEIRDVKKRPLYRYAVNHMHLSPDCTFFSNAKGGTLGRHTVCGDDCATDHTSLDQNTAERIRGLAWVGIGWAAVARPKRITLENVAEFQKWGPTTINEKGDVVPDKSREAETFLAFKGVLSTGIEKYVSIKLPKIASFGVNIDSQFDAVHSFHGWKREHPALGDIRKFLKPFLGADYDEEILIAGLGYEVEFKELVASDFGAPTSRKRLFMMARCDGIPLVWPEPTHGNPLSDDVKNGRLLPWRTAGECIDWSIVAPSIFETKEEIKSKMGLSVKRPLAVNSMHRIAAGMKKFILESDEPFIVKNMTGNLPRVVSSPLSTILTGNHHYLAIPHTTKEVHDKLNEVSLLTAAYIVNQKGTDIKRMPIGNDADSPITTVTAHDTHGVVVAHLQREFGNSIGSSLRNPAPTIMSGGGGKTSLIASYCIKMKGDNLGYRCSEPVQTITAGGLAHGLISSHLYKYYGADVHGQDINCPIHTLTTKERFGLITENLAPMLPQDDELRYKAWQVARMMEVFGKQKVPMLGGVLLPRKSYVQTKSGEIIYDIGMRMLTERELFTAQGFKTSFVFNPMINVVDKHGKSSVRKVTKTEAVRMVGNSVPPHFACALISALNDAEENVIEIKIAA